MSTRERRFFKAATRLHGELVVKYVTWAFIIGLMAGALLMWALV